MAQSIFDSPEYQQNYLPWANALMDSPAATSLVERVQADRNGIIKSTLLQPKLDRLTVQVALRRRPGEHKIDQVELIADFEDEQLKAIALDSLKSYFVILSPGQVAWPVTYGNSRVDYSSLLIEKPDLRKPTEQLVARTAEAVAWHMQHNLPLGNIPPESQSWTLTEGELRQNTLKVLRSSGVNTYGDLGILTAAQLRELVKTRGEVIVDEVKAELQRVGWLSPIRR